MDDAGMRKLGAVAGIVFGLLVILPFLALGDEAVFAGDARKIADAFGGNEGKLYTAAMLSMLAAFALAWFVAALRDRLGGDGTRSVAHTVVAIGGTIAATAYAIAGSVLAVGAARIADNAEDGADTVFLNTDLFMVIYGGAAPIGLAVLLSGVALWALRARRVVPVWLAWASLVLAVVGLIPPISWVLTFGIAVWSIVVGVLLLRDRATA